MSEPEQYKGKNISISFDAKRCIHSRNCVLGLPGVFRANMTGKWIDPDAALAEETAAIIRTCPSGALTYSRNDGGFEEKAPQVNVVRVQEKGPLSFHGELYFKGEPWGTRAVLCRCGTSKHKPFCDGSHRDSGFSATGEPLPGKTDPLEKRDGPLSVNLIQNGPLIVEGNLELCSGTGRPLLRTQKIFFCRCGGSNNKPFCDGSHKKIGFKSE